MTRKYAREPAVPSCQRRALEIYPECIYFNQQILECLVNALFMLVSDMFEMETDRKVVAHIKEWGEWD
jgi:hypothetical protein